ncbi:MAG: SDR family oxidoreductase [Thermoleophilia bacterium]|nr:SDR family oxidoreductase [Thermoleophilia bacterium]
MTRVAIVTGAARGIGAATVRALAADGWAVVAVDLARDDPRLPYAFGSDEELMASVAAAERLGSAAVAIRGDACEEAVLAEAVERAQGLGDLDAIVADAGAIAGGAPAWELAAEQQQAVIEVNLLATIGAARVGVPALLQRPQPRSGRFIALSSAAAVRGMPGLAAYSAAKAGVAGFIRGLAADLRGTGVTANAVSPGSTRTPLLDESARLYGLASAEEFAAQQPLERLLEPEEVAAMITWLAGPDSSAVTGATLPVDGGLSL